MGEQLHFPEEYIIAYSSLQIMSELGRGTFGVVSKAIWNDKEVFYSICYFLILLFFHFIIYLFSYHLLKILYSNLFCLFCWFILSYFVY